MFSLVDLLQSFIIAIFFIFLFKLHRELFPVGYFATGNILSEIEYAPSKKSVAIRFLIILAFGIILNFFIKDPKVIILGMTFGSFLIVWPIFLSDENIEGSLLEKKLALRFLLALFVAISYLIAKLSIVTFNIGNEVLTIYLQDFNKERIIKLFGDSLIWTILMLILGYISSYMRKRLNEKLTISPNNYPEEYDIQTSYLEVAVTEEPENEERANNTR